MTYLTVRSCCDFVNDKYFEEEPFFLTDSTCLVILKGLEKDGLLIEETLSKHSQELGRPNVYMWRYAPHTRCFPKSLYEAGYLGNGYSWIMALSVLWTEGARTSASIPLELMKQSPGTVPIKMKNKVLNDRALLFSVAGFTREPFPFSNDGRKCSQPLYNVSDDYRRLYEKEESLAKYRRESRPTPEPEPFIWPADEEDEEKGASALALFHVKAPVFHPGHQLGFTSTSRGPRAKCAQRHSPPLLSYSLICVRHTLVS